VRRNDYEAGIELVATNENVVMSRTFSKIYGMAGIRCGFAVGRPDLLAKLKAYGENPMPVTGSAAAGPAAAPAGGKK